MGQVAASAGHDDHHDDEDDMNMRAVFIHFLGDSLSSLLVLAVALMLKFVQGAWLVYADPVSSLLIVALTVHLTVPLVREVHPTL